MISLPTTRQVSEELNVPEGRIRYLIRSGKISPNKTQSGTFSWTKKAIRSLQSALNKSR